MKVVSFKTKGRTIHISCLDGTIDYPELVTLNLNKLDFPENCKDDADRLVLLYKTIKQVLQELKNAGH